MAKRRFKVQLTDSANADFAAILDWTLDEFGQRQAEQYDMTLRAAIDALAESAMPAGAKARDNIAAGICTLHVARRRRRGRHVLVYKRVAPDEIIVVRILHDGMDIARHLPSNDLEE